MSFSFRENGDMTILMHEVSMGVFPLLSLPESVTLRVMQVLQVKQSTGGVLDFSLWIV